MLVAIMEGDRAIALAIRKALRVHHIVTSIAHDYTRATALLSRAPRPSGIYVGQLVGDRPGPDLLAEIERSPWLAGIPLFAVIRSPSSFIASALRRGGVHVLAPEVSPAEVAATIACESRKRFAEVEQLTRYTNTDLVSYWQP